MKKLFLFDIDGVLNKSRMFSLKYQDLTGVTNDEMIGFFKGDFQKCLIGQADLKEVVEPWLSKWKWSGDVDSFLDFWFQVEFSTDLEIIKEVVGLGERGIKSVIVTNQEKYRTKYIWENMGFKHIMDKIYSSADLGLEKKKPEFFEKVKEDSGVQFEDMAFIDDDEKNIVSARSVGIESYLFKNNAECVEFIKEHSS